MQIGRKNAYVCDDLHVTITVDSDEGATPFSIICTHPGCNYYAYSRMYRINQTEGTKVPTHEFYKPSPQEEQQAVGATLEHIKQGGLLFRPLVGVAPTEQITEDSTLQIAFSARQIVSASKALSLIDSMNLDQNNSMFDQETTGTIVFLRNKFSMEATGKLPPELLL